MQKILVDSNRHKFTMTQTVQNICCWHCNIWPDWCTSHNGIPEFMIDGNGKMAQTTQNIWNFMPESLVYKKWQTLAIMREISDSNLETGKYGPKSGVSRIIQESWQRYLSVGAGIQLIKINEKYLLNRQINKISSGTLPYNLPIYMITSLLSNFSFNPNLKITNSFIILKTQLMWPPRDYDQDLMPQQGCK